MGVKCPKCGAESTAGSLYCFQCWEPLPPPEVDPFQAAVQPLKLEPSVDEVVQAAEPPPPAPTAAPTGARLVVTKGTRVGVAFPLTAGENEIGRWDEEEGYMPHIDLTEQDAEGFVSRRHAYVRYDTGRWTVEDAGSANGVRFRGQKEKIAPGARVPLKSGDEIVLGRVILRFEVS